VTSPSDPTDENPPSPGEPASFPGEPTPASNEPLPDASPPGPSDAAMNPVALPAAPQVEEGLPEWEPLTPELVEDEAIRGDFVIRWAVVGLALLFGISQINETRTLVHVRTGEYLASHGVLPPANDMLSCTASDRRWVNLSWLFDLFAAGVHAIGGGIGLSIVQGALAGVAFGMLAHVYRPGIRTWWGSICAALALLVCYPQFTMQPELITLVGLSVVLWLALRADDGTVDSKMLWLSVPAIWLWSQFDIRAFLGPLLLLAMAVGASLRRDEDLEIRRVWWRVTLAGAAVMAVHPFLWQAWFSPIRLFAIDYPALCHIFPRPTQIERAFYSIDSVHFWSSINHDSIAAFVLLVATIVTLVLNRERLHYGHVLAFVVFNVLACLATHELAAASFVNCAICTVNAQSWYRQRFGQVYSVDWRELLFSRGGRAATVLSLFVLAWLVISGRIDGPGGKRTGVGFDSNLLVQMNAFDKIAADSFDDHPFHFVARQGDLLIWSGQKSFLDTRAGLFTGTGERDLLALYDRTRRAMQRQREILPGSGEPDVWHETFKKYQITHTMPRLTGPVPSPDYITFSDLLSNSDWTLTDVSAPTVVFYYNDGREGLGDFLAKHRLDFIGKAFRTPVTPTDTIRDWPKPPSTYDNLFSLRQPVHPAGIQTAGHYLLLAEAEGSIPVSVQAACSLLAVREATAGLREVPNSGEGYRELGRAYLMLDRIETRLMAEAGVRWFNPMRFHQATSALQQAALLRPQDAGIQRGLLMLFQQAQRGELALDAIRQIKKLEPLPSKPTDDERRQREALLDIELRLEEIVGRVETQVAQQLENGADRLQVAVAAYQAGAVRLAIRTLEDDPIFITQNLAARTMLGTWLIEAGRVRDGYEALEAVEQASAMGGMPGWRDSVATSALTNGDYLRALRLWNDQNRETTETGINGAILTLPFLTLNMAWMSADQYPISHVAAVHQVFGNGRAQTVGLTLNSALIHLETGNVKAATVSMSELLDMAPGSQLQPLVAFYLTNLTGQPFEKPKPAETTPAEEFEPLDETTAARLK
jgi:hypothetical protein